MTEFNRDTYRDYDAINFSKLAQLDRNPSKVDEDKDWHDGMSFGALVDMMCFEPDKVEEEFYVSEADRDPSSTAKELADWLLESDIYNLIVVDGEITTIDGDSLGPMLHKAEEAVGSSTSFEKYGGVSYLKDKIQSQDKHVVSNELYQEAQQATRTLKTHEFTRRYFHDPRSFIEIQHQVPILWDPSYYDDELNWMAKSLLDTVIFNHRDETILPVDLKTSSSSAFMFERKMTKWRYYIQAAYYYDAINYVTKDHDEVGGYDLLPFEFIVLSHKDLHHPLIYQMNEEDLLVGRDGGTLSYNDREVRGWRELIKDLKWHEREGKWDYPREVYENNGKIEIDLFN